MAQTAELVRKTVLELVTENDRITSQQAHIIARNAQRIYQVGWFDDLPSEIILKNIEQMYVHNVFNALRVNSHNRNTQTQAQVNTNGN